jgi:hypothetical protein
VVNPMRSAAGLNAPGHTSDATPRWAGGKEEGAAHETRGQADVGCGQSIRDMAPLQDIRRGHVEPRDGSPNAPLNQAPLSGVLTAIDSPHVSL